MRVELADQFGALWKLGDSPPDVFAFLAQHGDAKVVDKVAVLLRDQRFRWNTDQPLRVEDYLAGVPELDSDPAVKLQLAVGEFQARRNGNLSLDIEEFSYRFADISETLCGQLSQMGSSSMTRDYQHRDAAATRTFPPDLAESSGGDRRIGRYRLVRLLGEGAFGRVYLGFDDEIRRPVAIKVPTPKQFRGPRDAEAYLAEARTVATLDHPNIVPVYDVGRGEDGGVYVVSKFIEGRTLGERMKEDPLSLDEAIKLVVVIAQALQHAHQRRLIHRDIKPANILIDDSTGVPHVADFGLAIREEAYLGDTRIAGTPAYMSPEQARGEGHRLDCRSDIFSLGVVFYQLLTGNRPFRGVTSNELLQQMQSIDPLPPRELDDSIPEEVERICLKAMSRRASARYATAAEMADDLLRWQQGPRRQHQEVRIVPRGLRSFDADDADFFLDLLPGPRDRDGLPESVRFWKTRFEETDPDKTFSVGLIYGPSGCGKSSLVKAGLLPRLSVSIEAVYVEATPEAGDARILRALRKQLPDLPKDLGLMETFAWLRRQGSQKVVLVLDQFEQWLHAHQAESDSELVLALRQCDGGQLQAVVMVRDDFAMAAARFMDSLDIPILQGHNFATVDLFDVDHAEKILIKFGQAFGKLPERTSDLSHQQREFVRSAALGLAHDGKVVSVRLALFAEMVKSKAFAPATLEQVGGTTGIGVNFLEETFSSRTANPKHRLHQQAAREVLQALLPEVGTDIKGHMRSHAELLEASAYQHRPAAFHELLRILDGELRLLTPTDPEAALGESSCDPDSQYYQLTHDYLVTALRQWLTSKQRETRKGRAEIRLNERSELWTARPESKQLPSLREWLSIRCHTSRNRWSPQQQVMMRAATKHHVRHLLLLAVVLALLATTAGLWWRNLSRQALRDRIDGLVNDLWHTKFEHLPGLLDKLAPHRSLWEDRVASIADNRASLPDERTRGYLALARTDGSQLPYLQDRMLQADAQQQQILRDELRPWKDQLCAAVWGITLDAMQPDRLIRAAALLADYAPTKDDQWRRLAPAVTDALVSSDPLLVEPWMETLYSVRNHLLPPLLAVYHGPDSTSSERVVAASVLARFGERDVEFLGAETLANLVLDASPEVYRSMDRVVQQRKASVLPLLRAELRKEAPLGEDAAHELLLARQANAAETLYRIDEDDEFWSRLGQKADPRLRTLLMDRVARAAKDWRLLLDDLPDQSNPRVRQAILLGLTGYERDLSNRDKVELTERLLTLFRTDLDAGVHSAAEWLLRQRLNAANQLHDARQQLLKDGPPAGANWSIERNGLTMIQIPPPGKFTFGWPQGEPGSDGREPHRDVEISYSFAISATEVTLQQFLLSPLPLEYAQDVAKTLDCPVNRAEVIVAMKFCRWLSEQEPDFDPRTCCYPPSDEIHPGMRLADDYQVRAGYRLPTVEEWEYASSAGAKTSRFFGNSEAHLDLYCRSASNADERTWPVGSLRPNPLGLFDVYGNVSELCHLLLDPTFQAAGTPIRGGDYRSTRRYLRSAMPVYLEFGRRLSIVGFRVVKVSRK